MFLGSTSQGCQRFESAVLWCEGHMITGWEQIYRHGYTACWGTSVQRGTRGSLTCLCLCRVWRRGWRPSRGSTCSTTKTPRSSDSDASRLPACYKLTLYFSPDTNLETRHTGHTHRSFIIKNMVWSLNFMSRFCIPCTSVNCDICMFCCHVLL